MSCLGQYATQAGMSGSATGCVEVPGGLTVPAALKHFYTRVGGAAPYRMAMAALMRAGYFKNDGSKGADLTARNTVAAALGRSAEFERDEKRGWWRLRQENRPNPAPRSLPPTSPAPPLGAPASTPPRPTPVASAVPPPLPPRGPAPEPYPPLVPVSRRASPTHEVRPISTSALRATLQRVKAEKEASAAEQATRRQVQAEREQEAASQRQVELRSQAQQALEQAEANRLALGGAEDERRERAANALDDLESVGSRQRATRQADWERKLDEARASRAFVLPDDAPRVQAEAVCGEMEELLAGPWAKPRKKEQFEGSAITRLVLQLVPASTPNRQKVLEELAVVMMQRGWTKGFAQVGRMLPAAAQSRLMVLWSARQSRRSVATSEKERP